MVNCNGRLFNRPAALQGCARLCEAFGRLATSWCFKNGRINTPLACAWVQGIHKMVLREFLNPRHWRPPENRDFIFNFDQIRQLCDQAEKLFQRDPSVLKLRGEGGGVS